MSATHAIKLLDERLLRLFDVLHATRSVSAAAAALGQAQPTVSIWLARLRREMNDQLFVRTSAGMAPTPRADDLFGTVRSAIELLQRLQQNPPPYDPTTDPRRFRICMTDASHATLLPELLATLRSRAPHALLEALPIGDDTGQLLQSGEADIALGRIPAIESGLYQQTLYRQDWVCLLSRDRRPKRAFTKADYAASAHVAIVGGTGDDLLAAGLTRARIERRVVLALPGFLGLGSIVARTDLIATLPRHTGEMLAQANDLRLFACPFDVASFAVKQHWHARFHDDPANQWLCAICAELFQKRGR